MEKALLTLILVLCSAVSFCEDLTWLPNSNWEVDSNWKLGRQPCPGDTVRFQESSRPSIVYLNSPVTVRGLQLSKNSRLALGRKAVIRLSNTAECDARSTVIAKAGDNVFVGARDNLWECPQNWKTADNKVPETAPCGVDRAIFPEDSTFSFVTFNSSKELSVAAVQLRGQLVTDLNNYSREFPSRSLTIRPECLSNGDLCVCPEVPKTCQVAPPNTGGLQGRYTVLWYQLEGGQSEQDQIITVEMSAGFSSTFKLVPENWSPGGIAAGVVIVVIVVIVIAIIAVIAVVWWMRSGRSASFHPYHKETLDEPNVTFSKDEEAVVNFDNPMFDSTSDFDELVGAEQLPEPTDAAAGGGGNEYEEIGDDLPEKQC